MFCFTNFTYNFLLILCLQLEDLKYNFYESIKLNKHYERLLFKLDKDDLVVGEGKKLSSTNNRKVKFADDNNDYLCGPKRKGTKVRMSDLVQSFESMNRSYKDNDNFESLMLGEDSGDADSDVRSKFGDENFRSFKFEDYLEDSDDEEVTSLD